MKKKIDTYTTPAGIKRGLFENMLSQSHLLIAGASGSGKSVLVNGLLTTALYRFPFSTKGGAQFILIDPKRVELLPYKNLPHTIGYASEPEEIVDLLKKAVQITEERWKVMGTKGLLKYDGGDIYVVIEELADLMTTNKRVVQPLIQRLCQIARAANVHCICVTQCPLREILCTPIKVNFDGVVALRTRCAQDSRNIIGCNGAELLPRYGECLYYTPDFTQPYQYSIPYDVGEKERLIHFWMKQKFEHEKPRRGLLSFLRLR